MTDPITAMQEALKNSVDHYKDMWYEDYVQLWNEDFFV